MRAATAAGLAAIGLAGLPLGSGHAAATAHTNQAAGTSVARASQWLPSTPASWPLVVDESRTPAQAITSGVNQCSQILDTVAGRQHALVLNIDLASPNVRVRAMEAGNTVIDPADKTVKSMGTRTGAVAGINGAGRAPPARAVTVLGPARQRFR